MSNPELPDDADYNDSFEMPPEHVVRAMSQIAIYAATYGTDIMYLRDPVVAKPIEVVQEWLKQWGYEFDSWQYAHAPAPEPEPEPEPPEPPADWDEGNDDDKPHYDTPGGW